MITLIYALIMIMIIVIIIIIIINNNNNKGHWREPWLKRRIENDIKNLRKDINLLGRDERREPRRKRNYKIKEAEGKYRLEKRDWSW